MTINDLEHFKELLLQREANVATLLKSPIGVNSNDADKVQVLVDEIKDALKRIENGTYGTCEVCKGTVEIDRLEIQPVAQICLECISAAERTNLEEELTLAGKIHRALLPQAIERIDGFEVGVKSLAARTVGGDYYDFLPGSDGDTIKVIVADVMGKGLPAGLMMSNIQGALRILAEDIDSPSKLISRLNRWLCHNLPITKFISMVCIAVKPESDGTSRITYVNAGHCPPILIRNDNRIERLDPTGGVLGVHEGFAYSEMQLELSKGDSLYLFTDGVTDAQNGEELMFGEERLLDTLKKYCSQSQIRETIEKLMKEIYAFTSDTALADDLTIMALRKY